MAFERPTLSELLDRIKSDAISRLQLTGAVLRRSMVGVIAYVVAGAAHMLHGHIEFISKQLFADTAEDEYLLRIGSLFGIVRNDPEYAAGTVTITGEDGSIIPEDTVLVRSDGVEYTVGAEVTISSGTATASITAAEAAEDGNADPDTVLTFESPITGVDAEATVVTLTGGTDEETIEEYRIRVLERMRSTPQGGAEADYVAWAKEVSGVTRVWVQSNPLGAGTVAVRFMRDDDEDPIPDVDEVAAVQDYLDERRPVTANVTVYAPTAVELDVTVDGLDPDNSETRAAIEAELADFLDREAEPGGTIYLSKLIVAVGTAAGVEDFSITVPAADVTHAAGEIAVLGTVSYT